MKSPRGFRGKYFSLAAILALSTTITLANETKSYNETAKVTQTQEEFSEEEELTAPSDELNVAVISKRIKAKKSKVYSASKNDVSATNVTDNVNILTSEEMELQGITTINEALDSMPGISITRSGGLGATSSIFMQGLANKYTLVLIDGVKQNDPSNFSGVQIDHIRLADIDKIEVIKGAQSGVWGADAVAGVINIITKKAKPGTHASIGTEIGSYNYKSLNASLSHRTHTYDLMLSVLHVKQDGFSAQLPYGDNLDDYEDDGYKNTTVNFKTGYWLNSDNRIEFGYHDINARTEIDGYNAPNEEKITNYRSKSGYLSYKYFLGKHKIETTLSQSYTDREESNNKGKTSSIEIKDTYKYGDNNQLVFGGNYEKRKMQYLKNLITEEDSDSSKALYLNNTYRYQNLILSQALRYDDFSDYDNKLTGKFGIKYLFSNDINIYTNISNGYLAPTITQLVGVYGPANFDLTPEKSESINFGLNFYDLNINFFQNKVDNMIEFNYLTYQYYNAEGTSKYKGIELSYQKIFFDKLLLAGNYTYTDAKKSDGSREVKRPRYKIELNASYTLTKDLIISANGTYVGSRKAYTGEETGRYFVANAKVDYNINKTWSTYFKVNNILDKEYQTTYGYATAERSFYLGVKANF